MTQCLRRLVLFAAIMGFAIGASLIYQPISQAQHVERPDADPNERTDQHKVTKTFGERLSIIWDRTWEDPVAFYTFVLGIFTALLAGVSATQIGFLIRADNTARIAADAAKKSADAAKRAADVAERHLVLTTRPWVNIRIEIAGPLIFNAEGGTIDIKVILLNVGPSPAIKSSFFLKMQTSTSSAIEHHRTMTRFVETMEMGHATAQSAIGATLFPNAPFDRIVTAQVSRADITTCIAENDSKKIKLYVAACVLYGLPSGGRFRYTSFIQGIHRRGADEEEWPRWFDDNQTYAADQLDLFGMESGVGETT